MSSQGSVIGVKIRFSISFEVGPVVGCGWLIKIRTWMGVLSFGQLKS